MERAGDTLIFTEYEQIIGGLPPELDVAQIYTPIVAVATQCLEIWERIEEQKRQFMSGEVPVDMINNNDLTAGIRLSMGLGSLVTQILTASGADTSWQFHITQKDKALQVLDRSLEAAGFGE